MKMHPSLEPPLGASKHPNALRKAANAKCRLLMPDEFLLNMGLNARGALILEDQN
jgi:hypothetical protein